MTCCVVFNTIIDTVIHCAGTKGVQSSLIMLMRTKARVVVPSLVAELAGLSLHDRQISGVLSNFF